MKTTFLIWLALLSFTAHLSPLLGQEVVELTGTLRGGQIKRLEMQSGERRWVVVLDGEEQREVGQRTELEFHAQGRPSILEAKMYVRFFAQIDATGNIVGRLEKLTWFTPKKETRYGAFPAEERDGEPLVRPEPADMLDAGYYEIVGWIASFRQGHLIVDFDGGRVQGEVARDAKVGINITNKQLAYQMMKPGDLLEVRGRAREGHLFATNVTVQREEVMGKELAALPERPERRPAQTANEQPPREGEPVATVDPRPTTPQVVEEGPLPVGGSFGEPRDDAPVSDAAPRPRARILRVN